MSHLRMWAIVDFKDLSKKFRAAALKSISEIRKLEKYKNSKDLGLKSLWNQKSFFFKTPNFGEISFENMAAKEMSGHVSKQ